MKRLKKIIILIAALSMLFSVSLSAGAHALDVRPSSPNLQVNGQSVYVSAYNIDGYNYFKIRDLAFILSDTEKTFAVEWDENTACIDLSSGGEYVPVGDECTEPAAAPEQILPSEAKLYLDGAYVLAIAYNIDGYNYFKLRDIMSALDVYTGWDAASGLISLETGRSYVPEEREELSSEEVARKASSVVELICYNAADEPESQGTGFFITPDGLVITCAHVLEDVASVRVCCEDGKKYNAVSICAYVPGSDLAVIKVDLAGDTAEPLMLGDSDSLVRGQRIMVISNPGGEQNTIADGLVSAFRWGGVLREATDNDIQISAPVYKGSSGGPVFDMQGRVVAVIYAMHMSVPLAGYAIPINDYKPILASVDGPNVIELRLPPEDDGEESEEEPAPEDEAEPETSSYRNP